MTDPKTNPKLDALNSTTPFCVVLHRTASRDNYKVFTGDERDAESLQHATGIAGRGGTAFLLTPKQIFTPPKEPVVEKNDLNFDAE